MHEHILGGLDVGLTGEVDAVVEETEVETEVPLFLSLPFDGFVGNLRGAVACAEVGVHHRHRRAPLVAADIGVTGLSPAEAEFTVVEPLGDALEE